MLQYKTFLTDLVGVQQVEEGEDEDPAGEEDHQHDDAVEQINRRRLEIWKRSFLDRCNTSYL